MQLKPVNATQSKSVKSQLSKAGLKVRVQIKKGTMYIYHNDAMGSFTPEEKSIIRDVLVLGEFVNCVGDSYTKPTTLIYSGVAIKAI